MKKNQTNILLAAILALGASLPVLHAQTWDGGGGTDRNWGTAANWNSDTAPNFAGTPNLTFTGSGTAHNESIGRTLGSITFNGSNSFTLSGSQFALDGNINFSGSGVPVTPGVTPTGDHTISSAIILNRTTTVSHGVTLNLSGAISGSGSIVKGGGGNMNLSGDNTFTGGVGLGNGSITISHQKALGAGPLQFYNNVTTDLRLNFAAAAIVENKIELSASTSAGGANISNNNNAGAVTLRGTLQNTTVNTTKTVTLRGSNTGENQYDGVIGGGGGDINLTKSGAGKWTLTADNIYSGTTSVTQGTLATSGAGTFGDGNITVSNNLTTLTLGNADSIADTATLTFGLGTIINLDFNETIGSLFYSVSSTFMDIGTHSALDLNRHFFGTDNGVFRGSGSLNVTSAFAIPEPSTFAGLAGLAALALGLGSRRRAKRTALTNC